MIATARRRPWRRLLGVAALAVGTVTGCRTGGAAAARAGSAGAGSTMPSTVRMLLVNDVYVTDTLRDGSGGLARVAGLRDSIERATGAPVLFVLAGDVLSPSVLGKWYGGAQMVEGFNAARLDYATLGNHEFDGSRTTLVARLDESRFRWLSGNCGEANGTAFPRVRGWDTVRVNGVKVGIFGTTVVRDYPSYVQCRDADTATTRLVDTLVAHQAELVVGLTHRFAFEDERTLATEPRVQAILGGHEHDGRRAERDGRVMVKGMSNARTAVLVTFTRRDDGWRVEDRTIPITRGMREDSAALASVRRWRDTLERRIGPDELLGIAAEPINALDSLSRRGESRFGNLVTDGMRAGTQADVALINSGALRFDDVMAAGPITRHLIEGIFLFADETRAVTFPLTGARLREVLETGVREGALGSGPYPQVSGVRFTIDASRPSGSRVVGEIRREDGRAIAPTDTLRVTFVTYPACRGGDGYRIPEAAAACRAIEANPASSPRTVDLLRQHLQGMGGRIVQPGLGRVRQLERR
jgi:2',3'-cyclic-nucleotide 2'-phosphodiesterase (5'-nucleotidase family)